ncbi:MAG: glycoside hydrolase family 27 protein, partial [bacterium]
KDGKIINARKDFGVYQFHEQDAQQYASWGIDYLKYDWANEHVPFTVAMHDALQKTDRDIILSISGSVDIGDVKSISQYSNLWRVNPDINDSWKSIYSRGFYHDRWSPYQSVGHWNDPDMLTVGVVGWGKSLHDTKLTPNEQYTHISLWALFSAPMILGCDLSQLDDFTLGLLKNNEVISINQDPKGRPAEHIVADYQNGKHVFVKKLYDGTYAIGLFNTSAEDQTIKFNIKDFHFTGKMLRDVWRQKDIGKAKEGIEAKVKPHGVVLLKVY